MVGTREKIENAVEDNPGISFTELKEVTGLSNGVIQYHVHKSSKLKKEKEAIVTDQVCKNCEFHGQCQDKCLQKILRKPTKSQIRELKEKGFSNREISKELDLADSTVSYHVSQLEELELLG